MASLVVPWDRRPEYLAFTNWTPIPGITSYVGPRGGTGTNRTSFHPGQAFLSEYNLPDIMYQLHPCEEWKRFKNSPLPEPKTNPDGSLVYEQWTRPGDERKPLLDFKLLPDKISSEEGWWYHEFVRRLDPRICHIDLIMREEASAERSRMTDRAYINLHLNTPGYRTYRPAWRMLAWQVTAPGEENNREQFVLERLTDAQKSSNTTRGSTPGLINPALGEIAGNRIALPDLVRDKRGPRPPKANTNQNPATQPVQPVQNKRGPRRRKANANNNPASQPIQSAQPAQVAQPAQAPQALPTSRGYQTQQPSESPQGNSSGVATAAFPVATTATGVPFQDTRSVAAPPGQNNLHPYTEAQAGDRAAMPPPPFPSAPRSRQLPPARVSGLHPDRQPPTYRLQKIDDSQAHTMGVDSSGTATDHEHELEHPFMSDQELAMMSAKSDEAMAEIYRLCEPLLGPPSSIQASPAMALSPALIEELGLGFLFQQADGELQGNWTENQMPNPAQTMEARNAPQKPPPVLSEKQRGKRKECDDGNEHLQDVQLDVEKHERRPRKQVKSVHHATPNPVSTMQAGNVVQQRTPMLPEKQGIKRKEYDGGNEQFQDVQLDVEKHERRPRKQVKSVHHATPQNNNQAQYHETSYIYQPQQHYVPSTDKQVQHHNTPYIYQPQQRYTPSTTDSEVDYTHGKAFGRPALQVVRPVRPPRFASVEDAGPYEEQSRPMTGPNFNQIIRPFNPQQHTASPLGTEFPTLEPSAGPAYTPTPAPTAQISGYQPMGFPPSGPTETPSYGNMQAGQTVWHPSPMPPQMHNWQGLNPQVATTRPRSRANRGQGREPLGTIETNHHYHPYATSKYGNG